MGVLGIHFTLVVFALFNSTWHVHLPAALGAGAGVLLTAVGAAMCLSAVYAYRSFKRLQGLDTTRLVTHGIYRWSRNPQAVGFWVAFRLYLPLEEERVHRLFGDAYERYRRRTHRYFEPQREDVAE